MITVLENSLLLLITMVSWIPRSLIPAISNSAAAVFLLVPTFALKKAQANVWRAFGLPPHSEFSRMFLRQWVRHSVTCAVETIQAIQNHELLRTHGFGDLKSKVAACEKKGKGILFVTSHLGSWELCAYFAGRACEKSLHVLAKPPKRPWARPVMNRLRRKMLVEVIWTDHKAVLKPMLSALSKGESLGFVMDQKPERRAGPEVCFFGVPTTFVGGPALLCSRDAIPVIGIHVVRNGPFRYHILSDVLVDGDAALSETDVSKLTQKFATYIEETIRRYPEQWTWNYKRWKESGGHSPEIPERVIC